MNSLRSSRDCRVYVVLSKNLNVCISDRSDFFLFYTVDF